MGAVLGLIVTSVLLIIAAVADLNAALGLLGMAGLALSVTCLVVGRSRGWFNP